MPQDTYVIPNYDHIGRGWGKILLLAPACMAGFGTLAYIGTRSVGKAAEWAFYGLITGFVPALLILAFAMIFFLGPKIRRLETEKWAKHSFSWYREAFPENAHPNGHVSCRHCGSHKTRVENLMNRTFMRAHACAQCGQTLYYSREKN